MSLACTASVQATGHAPRLHSSAPPPRFMEARWSVGSPNVCSALRTSVQPIARVSPARLGCPSSCARGKRESSVARPLQTAGPMTPSKPHEPAVPGLHRDATHAWRLGAKLLLVLTVAVGFSPRIALAQAQAQAAAVTIGARRTKPSKVAGRADAVGGAAEVSRLRVEADVAPRTVGPCGACQTAGVRVVVAEKLRVRPIVLGAEPG